MSARSDVGGENTMEHGRSLARVVAALRHQRRVVAGVLAGGLLLAIAAFVLVHPKYAATTSVLMVAEPPEAQNPKVPSTATKPVLTADLPTLATDATVLLRVRHDLGDTLSVETLKSHVRAKVAFDSGLMPVTYSDRSPTAAVRGANAFGTEITGFYREIATKRFDALIADLSGQLARRRSDLGRLDAQLGAAARTYPYVDVRAADSGGDAVANSIYQRLTALRAERDSARATLEADGALARSSSQLVANARPLAQRDLVETDPIYTSLLDGYANDVATLRRIESYANEKYPGLRDLRATVAHEAADVRSAKQRAAGGNLGSNQAYVAALDAQAKADAQLRADHARLDTIDGELAALHRQLGSGSIAANVARIRRDRDNAQASYATLATRLATVIADRAEAASVGSVVVVDPAQFAQEAVWSSGRVLAFGILVLTLWLAVTLAVLLENGTHRFHNDEVVESLYGVPVIGSAA
jgi:capsular polysaccharide biosynthesis protein